MSDLSKENGISGIREGGSRETRVCASTTPFLPILNARQTWTIYRAELKGRHEVAPSLDYVCKNSAKADDQHQDGGNGKI